VKLVWIEMWKTRDAVVVVVVVAAERVEAEWERLGNLHPDRGAGAAAATIRSNRCAVIADWNVLQSAHGALLLLLLLSALCLTVLLVQIEAPSGWRDWPSSSWMECVVVPVAEIAWET
jgi:hypothetical protein